MKKTTAVLMILAMLLSMMTFTVSAAIADGEDPTPENVGIAFTKSGIDVSYVRQFVDSTTGDPYLAGGSVGAHGGHETRIVRTENGTYAAYITSATGNQSDDKNGWWTAVQNDPVLYEKYKYYYNGIAKFRIIKITANGFESLCDQNGVCEFEYPQAAGSCTPNIVSDGNGKVYVTIIADDKDRYGSTMGTAEFTNGIWLQVFEVDTATDTVLSPDAPSRFDHPTIPFEDHGYGYSQPLLDVEHGKLYAITNGGEAEDPDNPYHQAGFIAWWIYDLNTRTWDPTCHTIERFSRRCYMNVYPDGNGGITFVTERCAPTRELGIALGCTFATNGYIWDALYVMHIPDPTVDYAEDTTIWEPSYTPGGKNLDCSASHYGTAGCTYLDDQGRIHVIYSVTYYTTPTSKTTKVVGTYHAMYDLSGNELRNELIPTTLLDKNGTKSYKGPAGGFAMTQGSDGVYYVFVLGQNTSKQTTLEIWSSPADDGYNFSKKMAATVLKDTNGNAILEGTKPIIGNTRNGSVLDGTAAIMFHTGGTNGDPYYYFSVTMDKPVPHDHVWVDTVVDPTCSEQGYTLHVCSICNKKVKDTYTDTIPHDYEADVTEPTCTDGGFTTYTCTMCGDTYVDDWTDPLDHAWDEGVVTLEPTETEDGVRTYTCGHCGATRTETIPATGAPAYVPGDINGDGIVNSKDLTRLLKYVSGNDVEVNEAALDVNGDGVVNSKDLTRLLKYVSGNDVEIF